MENEYSKFKIVRVIYNYFKNTLSKKHTYRQVLNKIDFNEEVLSPSIATALEGFYTAPPKALQIPFIFIGDLKKYPSITKKMLANFTKFLLTKKPINKFSNIKLFKGVFGVNFLTDWDIIDSGGVYLYPTVYITDKYISYLNTIDEIEHIVCEAMRNGLTSIKTVNGAKNKLFSPNKILMYTDAYVDDNSLLNIQNNIILQCKDSATDLKLFIKMLQVYNVPKLVVTNLLNTMYDDQFTPELIPPIVQNPIIAHLIKTNMRFRPITIQKFYAPPNKFGVFNTNIDSNLAAYFEHDAIYTMFNSQDSKKSTKLLGDVTKTEVLYIYNYNNVKTLYNDAEILNFYFPFNSKPDTEFHYNSRSEDIDSLSMSAGDNLQTNILVDIKNISVLSLNQHPLIYLFNNCKLSNDVPFVKFNDIQADNEIYKLYRPMLTKETKYHKPQISRELLDNWCKYNNTFFDVENLHKLQEKSTDKRRRGELVKMPQNYNKHARLCFKLKLGDNYTTQYFSGKVYNFILDDAGKRVAVNIMYNSKLIYREFKTVWNLSEESLNLQDIVPNQVVKFKKKTAVYADVILHDIENDGKIIVNIQVDMLKLKNFNIFSSQEIDFIKTTNAFLDKHIFSNKFYTKKFVVSYNDVNTPLIGMDPYHNVSLYKTHYHLYIQSFMACVNIIEKPDAYGITSMFHDDVGRVKILDILQELAPFVALDPKITTFDIGETVQFYKPSNTTHATQSIAGQLDQVWQEDTLVESFDEVRGLYTLRIKESNKLIEGVEYKYMKRGDKELIMFNYRTSTENDEEINKVVIDYHNTYSVSSKTFSTGYGISCIVTNCSNFAAMSYIAKILRMVFKRYDLSTTKISDKTTPGFVELVEPDDSDDGVLFKGDGDDDDVMDDSSGDDDDSDEDSELSFESESESDGEESEYTADLSTATGAAEVPVSTDDVKGRAPAHTAETSDSLFLNRLYRYDAELFNWGESMDGRMYDRYDKICQSNRIPKVLTDDEKYVIDNRDRELEAELQAVTASETDGESVRRKIPIKSYGFGAFDRDCEYTKDVAGATKKVRFNGMSSSEFVKTFGRDADYKELIGLLKNPMDPPQPKWRFTYTNSDGVKENVPGFTVGSYVSTPGGQGKVLETGKGVSKIALNTTPAIPEQFNDSEITVDLYVDIRGVPDDFTNINGDYVINYGYTKNSFPVFTHTKERELHLYRGKSGHWYVSDTENMSIGGNIGDLVSTEPATSPLADDGEGLLWSVYNGVDHVFNKAVTVRGVLEVPGLNYIQLKQLYQDIPTLKQQNPLVYVKTSTLPHAVYRARGYNINTVFDINAGKNPFIEKQYDDFKSTNKTALPNIKCKAIKYGTSDDKKNWYICPRMYDKITNTPLHWLMLSYTNPQIPGGPGFTPLDYDDELNWRIDATTGLDIEAFKPRYPKDTSSATSRPIWIYPRSGAGSSGSAYFYPGFLSYTKHPLSQSLITDEKDPIYPPCCYQNYSKKFNEIFKPRVQTAATFIHARPLSEKFKYNDISYKSQGRLCKSQDKLFNQVVPLSGNGRPISTQDPYNITFGRKLTNRHGVFIRSGIPQNNEVFFNLIFDIMYKDSTVVSEKWDPQEPPNNPLNFRQWVNIIKNTVVDLITDNANDLEEKIYYKDINKGFLDVLFRKRSHITSYQNFIEYTLSEDFKRYDIYYEILTSLKFSAKLLPGKKPKCEPKPGELLLIIFEIEKTATSSTININCPFFTKKLNNWQDLKSLLAKETEHVANNTKVAFALKYNKIFEPIYYKKYGSTRVDDEIIKTFDLKDIFQDTFADNKSYLSSIKNILTEFISQCKPDNKLSYTYPGKNKIEFNNVDRLIRNTTIMKDNNIIPVDVLSDGADNKVIALSFRYNEKIFSVPIFPEFISVEKINSLQNFIKSKYRQLRTDIQSVTIPLESEIPSLDEYLQFFSKLASMTKQAPGVVTIKVSPTKYYGIINSDSPRGSANLINLDVKGFGVSFLSDIEHYKHPHMDKTLLYLVCRGPNKNIPRKQLIYDYYNIDRFINNEIFLKKCPLNEPVDLREGGDTYILLKGLGDNFQIETLYRDNSVASSDHNIILLKTSTGIFIPVKPIKEISSVWDSFEFHGEVSDFYVPDHPRPVQNPEIKITTPLQEYCRQIQALGVITEFKLPIFIKNFEINTTQYTNQESLLGEIPISTVLRGTTKQIRYIYLDSGILIDSTPGDLPNYLKIPVEVDNRTSGEDPDTNIPEYIEIIQGSKDKKVGYKYLINELRKINVNFYTQKHIADNKLDIAVNYRESQQLSKFNYDLNIYEALVKKFNEFFSIQNNRIVKDIRLFIEQIVSSTNFLHNDTKKRLLYPILFKICDILIESVSMAPEDIKYPNININNLLNIEHTGDILLEEGDYDTERYIKLSYEIMTSLSPELIDQIPNYIKPTLEYIAGAENFNLDFNKAAPLFTKLLKQFKGTQYKQIQILDVYNGDDSDTTSRSDFIKHKLCNNIIYNSYIQDQIFGIYEPELGTGERFKYDLYYEILFTRDELNNDKKLDALYKFTKLKFYTDVQYPEVQDLKRHKYYTFTYKGKTKRTPFNYTFSK